jgi:Methylase involved in ubiquinone/menaquinone biosynthesis
MKWILFPPPVTQTYQPGDHVFIRTKSRKEIGRKGVVISRPSSSSLDKDAQEEEELRRVWVRMPSFRIDHLSNTTGQSTANEHEKNSIVDQFFTTSFRPNRLVKIITDSIMFESACGGDHQDDDVVDTIVAITETTDQYRLLATSQIQSTDHVLEIGCSNGECSLVIAKYLSKGSLVAFDTSQEMIAQAKDKISSLQENVVKNTRFHVVDPFTEPRRALLLAGGGGHDGVINKPNSEKITVVLIDIGGNRDLESVLKMLAWVNESFSPRLCIVKSKHMVQEIRTDSSCCTNVGEESSKDDDERPTVKSCKRLKMKRPIISIQSFSGVIANGKEWFHTIYHEKLIAGSTNKMDEKKTLLAPRFSHPKRAPLSLSPKDGKTPICRYYNYHKNGCIKSDCTNDHVHCHWCLKPGHIALHCTNKQE